MRIGGPPSSGQATYGDKTKIRIPRALEVAPDRRHDNGNLVRFTLSLPPPTHGERARSGCLLSQGIPPRGSGRHPGSVPWKARGSFRAGALRVQLADLGFPA